MKTLNELIDGVRKVHETDLMNHAAIDCGHGEWAFDPLKMESYKVGHAAACEVLVPALKEAMTCLEYYPTNLVKDCEERIASLLSGKKAGNE